MSEINVGIRELKSRLSEYLRQVKAGETVTITDRGQPVGRIVPIARSLQERLDAMTQGGSMGGGDWVSSGWTKTRLIRELHARDFHRVRATIRSPGVLWEHSRTGAQVRIMKGKYPRLRSMSQPAAKYRKWYVRTRSKDSAWGPHKGLRR